MITNIQVSYRKAQDKEKIQRNPPGPCRRLHRARRHAGETCRSTSNSWTGRSPRTAKKSNAPRCEHLHHAQQTATAAWIPANTNSRSTSTDAAITVAGLGESASKLQGAATTQGTADLPEASTGAPRTEKKVAIHKSFSNAAAFSTAPPASSLLLPTLCTRRDLPIP
jgi:hypothetical protein